MFPATFKPREVQILHKLKARLNVTIGKNRETAKTTTLLRCFTLKSNYIFCSAAEMTRCAFEQLWICASCDFPACSLTMSHYTFWIVQVSHISVTPHSRFCSTAQLSSGITAARHLMGKTSAETPPPIIDLFPLTFPLSVRDWDKNLGGWCVLKGEDCESRAWMARSALLKSVSYVRRGKGLWTGGGGGFKAKTSDQAIKAAWDGAERSSLRVFLSRIEHRKESIDRRRGGASAGG